MERLEQELKASRERLEQDLRFFRQELERERDRYRRNLLMSQIRDVQQSILNILIQERALVEQQNTNLQDALNDAIKMKKK